MGHRHGDLRGCSLVASNHGSDRTPATMMIIGGGAPRRSLTTRQSTPRRFAPRSEIRDPRPGECERGGHATGTRVSRPFEQRVRRLSMLSRGRPDRWSKNADEPGAHVGAAMFPFEQQVEEARIPGLGVLSSDGRKLRMNPALTLARPCSRVFANPTSPGAGS